MLTEQQPKPYIPYQTVTCTWEAIQKIGYENVVEIVKSWPEITKQNSEIYKFNNALYAEALQKTVEFFKEVGVKFYKVSVYGKRIGTYKEAKTFVDALAVKYKIRNISQPSMSSITYKGERISTVSGNSLSTLASAKNNYERMICREQENSTKFKEALKVAKEENIDITTCSSPEEVFNAVNEYMENKFKQENFPDGTVMYMKHACDCSEWIVGEHRCSCGSRRMSLCIEGDFVSGFYGFAEPY